MLTRHPEVAPAYTGETQRLPAIDAAPEAAPSQELRELARVIKAALGIVQQYWRIGLKLPDQHPYRQAALTLVRFLERRYGV